MALKKKRDYWYGDSQLDLRGEIKRYSEKNGYVVVYGADAVCVCGQRVFYVGIDDEEGVAVRTCVACEHAHPMGDSASFLSEVSPGALEPRECVCKETAGTFEVTVGVSLYSDSRAVRWFYLGCRCVRCGLVGVYGDWKNEFDDWEKLLANV